MRRGCVVPLLIILGSGRAVKLKGWRFFVMGGKRGKIIGFSWSARSNMMEHLRALDYTKLRSSGFVCYFATGTYQADLALELLKAFGMGKFKEHLKLLAVRFSRADFRGFFFWKLEFTQRGAPHFHFLFFVDCFDYWWFRDWFSQTWVETFQVVFEVSSDDTRLQDMFKAATNVRWVRMSMERVAAVYAVKEVGKTFQTEGGSGWVGRYWGIVNRKLYDQFVSRVEVDVPLDKFFKLRRILVNLNWAKGCKVRIRHRGQGVKDLFTLPDTANKLLRLLGGDSDEGVDH